MTDNEKRAHDLAVSCLPGTMNESGWKYYLYNEKGDGRVNPDIFDTYQEFYNSFLEEFKDTF